jgi:hypothetical protein
MPSTWRQRAVWLTAWLVVHGLGNLLSAQVADRGTLLIQQGGHDIGHEDFRVRPAQPGRAAGDSVIASARYPETRPVSEIRATLELIDPGTFHFELLTRGPQGSTQMYASGTPARVTVRSVGRTSEAAREFPGGPGIIVLDDSLFSLFLPAVDAATEAGARLTGLYPRTGRRVRFTATRERQPVTQGGIELQVIRLMGDVEGRIYIDAQGHLSRIELPASGIEATRLRS